MWFERKAAQGKAPAVFSRKTATRVPKLLPPPWLRAAAPPDDQTDTQPEPSPAQTADPPPEVAPDPEPQPPPTPAPRIEPPVLDEAREADMAARRELEALQRETLARLAQSIQELGAVRAALAAELEVQLVQLAGKIAKKVVQRELATSPELMLELAREGIEALGEKGNLVVRLGALIDEETTADFLSRMGEMAQGCKVLFDPDLPPGTCVVEGQAGRVDESIDERLDNVMRGVLADHPG